MAFLTSITIERLTDAKWSLSRLFDQRLGNALGSNRLFAACHAGQGSCIVFNVTKNLNVQIFVVFILHTAGTYEIYENLHQTKISRYTVVHCHCYYTCIHSVFDHNFSQKSIDWGYSSFMKWKVQRVFTSTLHCTEYLHSGCSFPLAPSGCH